MSKAQIDNNRQQTEQQQTANNRQTTTSVIYSAEQPANSAIDDAVEKPFVCSVCGKRFKTLSSLKGHVAGSGHKGGSSQYLRGEEERGISKVKEVEEPSIPDPYQHLQQMLITFGLTEKNSGAIVEFMKSYSVDDLYKLVEVCGEYMPRSRLKLFIESWANVRGILIPPEIEESLGIDVQPRGFIHYPRSYRRPVYEDEVSSRQDALSVIMQGLVDMNKILLSKVTNNPNPNPPATTDNSKIDLLLEKFNNLDERLKRLEEGEAKKFKEKELEVQRESINKQYEVQKAGLDLIKQQLQSINRKTDLALRTIIEIGSGNKIKVKPIRNHEGEIIGFEPSPASSYQIRKEEENAELTEEEIERLRELGIPVEEE